MTTSDHPSAGPQTGHVLQEGLAEALTSTRGLGCQEGRRRARRSHRPLPLRELIPDAATAVCGYFNDVKANPLVDLNELIN